MKRKRRDKLEKIPTVEFLHTGSHLLNLAVSGKANNGGWARGRIINIVGDGSTGKTLLALEACADAIHYLKDKLSQLFPKIKTLNIVYNNKEGFMDFDLEEMYGKNFTKSIEWTHSETCENFGRDFQRRVMDLKKGTCLIYVMDSLDALDSEASVKRITKSVKTDQEEEGTYGVEKAKYFSKSFFSRLCSIMKGKDVTLFLISQTRQKINPGLFEEKTYRTGGSAMNFYTHLVCWLGVVKKLSKEVRGTKKIYGVRVRANIKRSKVGKAFGKVDFDIVFNYGIDNIGSIVSHLKLDKKLISTYENDPEPLIDLVEKSWIQDEKDGTPKRKKRFQI